MADLGRWFKLWCTAVSDPDLDNLPIATFGRWAKLGAVIKEHGTNGKITISAPAKSLCAALQCDTFDALIKCIEEMPNVNVTPVTNATVTYEVEYRNWLKYQGDMSNDRVRSWRERNRRSVTPKRRGEERRREEKRREESIGAPPQKAAPLPKEGHTTFQTCLDDKPFLAQLAIAYPRIALERE